MNNILYFNFYGNWVQVKSQEKDLLKRLEMDFSYFLAKKPDSVSIHFDFECLKTNSAFNEIPKIPCTRQSQNSITYDQGPIRYNDYYGKALTIYNFDDETAKIYCIDINRLHEITYLLILSRVGKKMDLKGVHKLHAFGVITNETAVLGIMPSKGGKSTMFLELLKDPKIEILSDDTPLVSSLGEISAFPIRLGLDSLPAHYPHLNENNSDYVYELERDQYGLKHLICLKAFPNRVGLSYKKSIIFKGVRSNSEECIISPCSKISMLGTLFSSMVIGLGLPMILEYFWQQGFKDFLKKSQIALLRITGAIFLLMRSKTFTIYLGKDPIKNAEVLKNFLNR